MMGSDPGHVDGVSSVKKDSWGTEVDKGACFFLGHYC